MFQGSFFSEHFWCWQRRKRAAAQLPSGACQMHEMLPVCQEFDLGISIQEPRSGNDAEPQLKECYYLSAYIMSCRMLPARIRNARLNLDMAAGVSGLLRVGSVARVTRLPQLGLPLKSIVRKPSSKPQESTSAKE